MQWWAGHGALLTEMMEREQETEMTFIPRDADGRVVAEPQTTFVRPAGVWDTNTVEPLTVRPICAWCPEFDRHDLRNAGKSHGMCSSCYRKMMAGGVQ
jgi:hypothetical protein